jgi:hypothetical protein
MMDSVFELIDHSTMTSNRKRDTNKDKGALAEEFKKKQRAPSYSEKMENFRKRITFISTDTEEVER